MAWLGQKWPYLGIAAILGLMSWLGSMSEQVPCPAPVESMSPLGP